MKIKWGALVVDGSGKLGGHVASKNKAGSYLRTKVTPLNPQSEPQALVRARFASLSQGWAGLTEENRTSWREAVESFKRANVFGDLKSLSGKSLYQSLNGNLLTTGQTTLASAPQPSETHSVVSLTADGAVAVPAFDVDTVGDTTGSIIVVRATPELSPGTAFIKNQLRDIEVATGGSDVSINILASYTARFGAPTEGANIWVAVHTVNAVGQASPAQKAKAVIAA